jgi:splicing factor 3B subunit 4
MNFNPHAQEKNKEATVYVGNLDERVTESLLWELMLQAGPVANVTIPKDRVTQQHQGYGFVEFMTQQDAEYSVKIMNMVKLFNKPVKVNKASSDKKDTDVGANLFVGNLAPEVDEQILLDTFSSFGQMAAPPLVSRDGGTGLSRGFGFISFDNFDSSDAAIEGMNGSWLSNKQISVSYAFKKNGRGEKHGSSAERLLAAQAKKKELEESSKIFGVDTNPLLFQNNF